MSINFQVLGKAGRDNSLFLRIDSGQRLYRILIDCGESTVSHLSQNDVKSIDMLLFSHLHLDHIAGFDYFFRRTFDRSEGAVKIYGPSETSSILHHRFKGFMWNLTEGLQGGYYVNDILNGEIKTYWYEAQSGFSQKLNTNNQKYDKFIYKNENFSISAARLNHRITSIGYNIKETDSININKEELLKLNLEPGSWLNKVKDPILADDTEIMINESSYVLRNLRSKLISITEGKSISYLTDFIFDDESQKASIEIAKDSDVLICESQYSQEDESLAKQNYHLTSVQAASIASHAKVKKLILFHISERYIHNVDKMKRMLEEARRIFAETYYPDHWSF